MGELGDALRGAVEHLRVEPPPSASLSRAMDRARRIGPGKANPWLRYHRIVTAAAVAAVLMLTFGLLLFCWRFEPTPNVAAVPGTGYQGGDKEVTVRVSYGPGATGPRVIHPKEYPFVETERDAVSTFPLTLDPTAYGDLRRALLEEKRLPPPETVRVADLINSFPYSYPEPTSDAPVSLTLDLAECPWNAAHPLVRIGLRVGADAAARAAQVTFNSRRMAAYRLIGWEDRRGGSADAVDALGGGGMATAFYEIVPVDHAEDGEWLTAEIRCRDRRDRPREIVQSLAAPPLRFAEVPEDFRFATAVAEFGLLLRGSAPRDAGYAAVRTIARGALGADADGRRAEFLALVGAAEYLDGRRKLTDQRPRSGRVKSTDVQPLAWTATG